MVFMDPMKRHVLQTTSKHVASGLIIDMAATSTSRTPTLKTDQPPVVKPSTVKNKSQPATNLAVVTSATLQTNNVVTPTASSNVSDLADSTTAQPPATGTSVFVAAGIGILLLLGLIGFCIRRKVLARSKSDTSEDKEWIANNQASSRSISSRDHSDLGSLSDARPLSALSQYNRVPSGTEMTQARNNNIANNINPYPYGLNPGNQANMKSDYNTTKTMSDFDNRTNYFTPAIDVDDTFSIVPLNEKLPRVLSQDLSPPQDSLPQDLSPPQDSLPQDLSPPQDLLPQDLSPPQDSLPQGLSPPQDSSPYRDSSPPLIPPLTLSGNKKNLIKPHQTSSNGSDDSNKVFRQDETYIDFRPTSHPLDDLEAVLSQFTYDNGIGSSAQNIATSTDSESARISTTSPIPNASVAVVQSSDQSIPTSSVIIDLSSENLKQASSVLKQDELSQPAAIADSDSMTESTIQVEEIIASPVDLTASTTEFSSLASKEKVTEESEKAPNKTNGELLTLSLSQPDQKEGGILLAPASPVPSISVTSDDSETEEVVLGTTTFENSFADNALSTEEISELSTSIPIIEEQAHERSNFVRSQSEKEPTIDSPEVSSHESLNFVGSQSEKEPTIDSPEISSHESSTFVGLQSEKEPTIDSPEISSHESSTFVGLQSEKEPTIDSSEVSSSTTSVADNQLSTTSKIYRSPTLSMFSLYDDQETTERKIIYRPPINGSHVKSVVNMFDSGRIVDVKEFKSKK